MSMTLNDYIHEYDFYDDLREACDDLDKELVVAMFDYKQAQRTAEKKVMFENADYTTLMEGADDNFFARIGKAIEKVIQAIGTFVKTIFDRILGKSNSVKKSDDEVIANVKKMMGKNPEFDKDIIEGIKEGKFTLHDVAQFSDDYKKVMDLIEKQKEDAPTIRNKIKKFCEKVENSAALKITTTVTGVIGAVTLVGTSVVKVAELIGNSKSVGYKLMSHNQQVQHDFKMKEDLKKTMKESVMTESRKDDKEELKKSREFAENFASLYTTLTKSMSVACMKATKEYRAVMDYLRMILKKHGVDVDASKVST